MITRVQISPCSVGDSLKSGSFSNSRQSERKRGKERKRAERVKECQSERSEETALFNGGVDPRGEREPVPDTIVTRAYHHHATWSLSLIFFFRTCVYACRSHVELARCVNMYLTGGGSFFSLNFFFFTRESLSYLYKLPFASNEKRKAHGTRSLVCGSLAFGTRAR